MGIQAADVARVIQGESLNIPGGPVEEGARRLNVQTSGQYRSVEEIRNTVIAGTGTGGDLGGRLVRVGDVADVQWDYENQ
ncbi:efflux RND transporter permease subunit, partial [Klebsiella pneumoniae]|uniref:efflux RND transporter permease subunit n=1 Tax=Klebsiella pneumoniae TaxID=573 RepID=UPI0034D2663A